MARDDKALTVRDLRELLAECPDQDAVVFTATTYGHRVFVARSLFVHATEHSPAVGPHAVGALVLGSRGEEPGDWPEAEEVAS